MYLKIFPFFIFFICAFFAYRVTYIFDDIKKISFQANSAQAEEQNMPENQAKKKSAAIDEDIEKAMREKITSQEKALASRSPTPSPPPLSYGAPKEKIAMNDAIMSSTKIELLNQLIVQKEKLKEREETVDQKENFLKTLKLKVDQKTQELEERQKKIEEIKEKLEKLKEIIVQEEDKKLDSLVKIYSTMKAKDAAKIFNELDITVLINVISHMREANAAPVLAAMRPDKAKTVTNYLAQKSYIPPLPK